MTQTWAISAAGATATISLTEGVLMLELSGSTAGIDTAPAPLSQIAIDRQPLRWSHLISANEGSAAHGGPLLTLELSDDRSQLQLTQYIEIYPDHPFVRTWGLLSNHGTTAVLVTDCHILSLNIAKVPLALFHVEQFSWPYRREFFTQNQIPLAPGRAPHELRMGSFPSHYWGNSSCAWFALRDGPLEYDEQPREGTGLVAGIEFNGKSRLYAWATSSNTLIENRIDTLAHRLEPQQIFEVPAWFIGRYAGDWDEAGYVTQRFAEAHVHPPRPDQRHPWVQYNSWRYEQNIHEQQQLAAIERCAELGIEVAVMDLGWARMIGDWRPDPVKFPRGLAPLAARAKELGIRFGVHMALAQCNPQAPIALEHPEWLIHTNDDYYSAGPLCLGHDPCREWLIAQILRLIDEEGITYLIQDGEDMVKRCEHSHHTHAVGDSNYANSQYGIDRVIGTIRRERPHVALENCEDGGCMMTYKMARLYHTSITVDNIATYATRQGIYGASYPFSPRYSVRYMQDDPTPYTLRSAIFGGPLIFMQRITEWNEQQIADTRAAIGQYKAFRELIRDGKIIHLHAPRHNLTGLGWGWDAIQAVSPTKDQSVVMIYRAQGDSPNRVIRPRGLLADSHYRVRYDSAGLIETRSGASIMQEGLSLALPEFASELIELSRMP